MLDKIKTLKEIIEPKANELGLSFKEVSSRLDNATRLNILLKNIFPKKPNNKTLTYCFDLNGFKEIARKGYGIKINSQIIEEFNKKSLKHANQYNDDKLKHRHKRKLFFNKIGKGTYLVAHGQAIYGKLPLKRWLKARPMHSTYHRLVENNCNVNNYLIVLNEWSEVEEYVKCFNIKMPDYGGIQYSTLMKNFIKLLFMNSYTFKNKNHWELTEDIDKFVNESGFKYRYDLPPIESIKDLKAYVDECRSLFKAWISKIEPKEKLNTSLDQPLDASKLNNIITVTI